MPTPISPYYHSHGEDLLLTTYQSIFRTLTTQNKSLKALFSYETCPRRIVQTMSDSGGFGHGEARERAFMLIRQLGIAQRTAMRKEDLTGLGVVEEFERLVRGLEGEEEERDMRAGLLACKEMVEVGRKEGAGGCEAAREELEREVSMVSTLSDAHQKAVARCRMPGGFGEERQTEAGHFSTHNKRMPLLDQASHSSESPMMTDIPTTMLTTSIPYASVSIPRLPPAHSRIRRFALGLPTAGNDRTKKDSEDQDGMKVHEAEEQSGWVMVEDNLEAAYDMVEEY